MRRSIRLHLMAWVLALLLPLSAGAGWLLLQVFGNRLLHDSDVAMKEEAETVAELVASGASPSAIRDFLSHVADERDLGRIKYIVVTRDGQIVAEQPPNAETILRSPGPTLRISRYESRASGHAITVSIAVSAETALHMKRRLASLLAVGMPLGLVLAASGLWIIIGRALRPLQNAARVLDQIAADTLSVRVPVENPDDEVGRMATVLNRMLDRLEHAVSQLQRLTADAAHELRTPLTVLRTGLDVALSRERSAIEYRIALTDALASTDRLCRLAEDLLTLARLETGVERVTGPVDVNEVLHELAKSVAELATQHSSTITVAAAPDLWVRGHTPDLYRLFVNLIENAVRHGSNGTARKREIRLVARQVDNSIEVTVEDEGPGIAPQDLSRVFDRFYRGSGERTTECGTGLGLSIALEVSRIHRGALTLSNRDEGGCRATVTLPADLRAATAS